MIKIRMLTTAADPDGVLLEGSEPTVSDEKAKQLIMAGSARPIKTSQTETTELPKADKPEPTRKSRSQRQNKQRNS